VSGLEYASRLCNPRHTMGGEHMQFILARRFDFALRRLSSFSSRAEGAIDITVELPDGIERPNDGYNRYARRLHATSAGPSRHDHTSHRRGVAPSRAERTRDAVEVRRRRVDGCLGGDPRGR
jgi:hypothetical protein